MSITDFNGPIRPQNLWHHGRLTALIRSDLESHILSVIAESGTLQRSRLAVERSDEQSSRAVRIASRIRSTPSAMPRVPLLLLRSVFRRPGTEPPEPVDLHVFNDVLTKITGTAQHPR